MSTADTTWARRVAIPTLVERKVGGFLAIAYCPVCDRAEKSNDEGRGQEHALDASVAKIRAHLRLAHHIA
jgi:hypothetical protein